MESRINEYFDSCKKDKELPTMPGLARYLGFESRQSLWDYGQKPLFSYTIKNALLAMEEFLVRKIAKQGNPTGGLIFLAKNWFDYRDQKDVAVAHSYDKDSDKIDFVSRIPSKKTQQDQELMH